MAATGESRAVIAALLANAGIAVAKFIGFLVTSSSSLLAESAHSVADTANQGLLLLGRRRAERGPTARHQFGHGRLRYFYAFVVALLLFTLGSVFALYEGIHKVLAPEPITSPIVAVGILLVAIVLEAFSLRTAVIESRPLKGSRSWWQFIQQAKTPELPVVLLEDSGALVGLVFALAGVSLTVITGEPVWDGIGTVAIGVLLGIIATILIHEMKSLLIGEGATEPVLETIERELAQDSVERVIHIRTEYLAPDELLVAAKIALRPKLQLDEIARAIDDAEARVRAAVPEVELIYLEPDLDRTTVRT